ncbi:TPA: glycosyltransferase [Bacillus anthracis]|nr:glycosyltransferase [Bacillus anthracis]
MQKKKVSVLIPLYNAEVFIRDLMRKLEVQSLPKDVSMEIITVDSSSSDNTVAILNKEFPKVKCTVIKNKDFDHGGTRNLLMRQSDGDYLLYMTQDAIPVDNYLIANLLAQFEDENVKIVTARQIPRENVSPLEKFARNFNYPAESKVKTKESIDELGIKTFFNSNVCSMYHRTLFREPFKGFPEKIILNEDMILAYETIMSGYKVVYEAEAKVFHSHDYSLKQQFKRYFDIGMAFDETSYILENVSNEKEGLRMIKAQQGFLWRNKKFLYIPYSLCESVVKLLGYKVGKKHQMLGYRVKKKLSAYLK